MMQRKETFYNKRDSDRVAIKLGVLVFTILTSILLTSVLDLTFLEALGALGVVSVYYVLVRSSEGLSTFYGYAGLMCLIWIVSLFSGWALGFLQVSGVVMVLSLIFLMLKKELPEFPEINE